MKHILKAKKRFLCLLLAGALAACLSPAALAAPDGVEVAPGYDYTRFKDAGITLNVYNWGEYISGGADGSMDVVKEFENLTGIRVNYTTYDTNESLYAKLKSGGGNYDVIIPSDYMIGKMAPPISPTRRSSARHTAPNRSTLRTNTAWPTPGASCASCTTGRWWTRATWNRAGASCGTKSTPGRC